ncbi:MAG: hypothetical protein HFJ06_03090 [Lachnospiraceae bacterium]|nr:hypothetical protein [Lachnospiraceae bacterium]
MKDVNIYIYTEYKGSLKSGNGIYNVILETTIQDIYGNDIPWTNLDGKKPKPVTVCIEDITKNRLDLLAVSEALSHLTKQSRVTVYTASEYITNAFIQGWTDKWEKNGYKSGNKPVKHADLWKSIMEQTKQHEITFQYVSTTPYMKAQIASLKKMKEGMIT